MENTNNTENVSEKSNSQQLKIDLKQHLLSKGEVFYLRESVDTNALFVDVANRIRSELKFEASYSNINNIHTIEYKAKGGISKSLGFSTTFKLFFKIEDEKLFFDIKNDKWFETGEDKFSIGKLFSTSKYDNIQTFISGYLIKNTISDIYSTKLDDNNLYINEISDKKKLWFYCNSKSQELMLAFLPLSSMQNAEGNMNADKDLSWYFLITTDRVKIISFDKQEKLVQEFDCEVDTIKVKKELGRNRFMCNDKTFLCSRSNNDMFYQLGQADLSLPESRMRETVRLNWLNGDDSDENKHFAIELIKLIIAEQHSLEDEISLLYMEYSQNDKNEVFSLFAENNRLLLLLDKVVINTGSSEWLISWIEKWDISHINSAAINKLLIASTDDAVQANNILPFHRFVRKQFYNQDKDKINRALFDIDFCKHLIKSELLDEAKKILKKNLKQLPNEGILDLLPGKDIDLTGSAAGQIIRVSILELLIKIESGKNAITHKCQLASLQPLVELRINELIKTSEKEWVSKGQELKNLMLPQGIQNAADEQNFAPQFHFHHSINAKLLDKYVRHPMAKKGEQFTKFQKWLATVKSEDHSILKSYSEKLNANSYEYLSQIIDDVKQALSLTSLEVYIARGEKSFGINSFEGEPNFILVGIDHLNKNSDHYLSPLELRFAVAHELAHLYFKHARITSSDVWRGALDKGNIVLDAILTLIPAAGLFGKSIQGISKLNKISSFLQATSKAGRISETSRDILTTSENIVKIYKSKSKKDKKERDKEKEFWATARIIQATSDRCALVLTRNIKAAVRAILLLSKHYNSEIANIEEKGLRNYLLEQQENGSFANQELAIRLSGLFSFYLSDDYKNIIKKLNTEEHVSDNEGDIGI